MRIKDIEKFIEKIEELIQINSDLNDKEEKMLDYLYYHDSSSFLIPRLINSINQRTNEIERDIRDIELFMNILRKKQNSIFFKFSLLFGPKTN